MLYPIENEIRQVKSLDGIWRFKKENRMEEGFEEKWYEKPLSNFIDMPVPASYNDITTDKELRDHVGWVHRYCRKDRYPVSVHRCESLNRQFCSSCRTVIHWYLTA